MAQILVVDDSATVRNSVSEFFISCGLTTVTAVDGIDGLDKLKSDSEIKLVILDVNMPNMDGLTMAQKVRIDFNKKKLAIIMLTTETDPVMKQKGKDAGVKGWIIKPFNGNAVINGVRKIIGLHADVENEGR